MFSFLLALSVALVLDALVGDPAWRLHPVRLMGGLCTFYERIWRELFPSRPRLAGVATALTLLGSVLLAAMVLLHYAHALNGTLEWLVATFLLYTSIAARDLQAHAQQIAIALVPCRDVELARERVGWIVGRDTASLDWQGVVRATVESVAENMADGVIAPIFAAFVAVFVQGLGEGMSAALSPASVAATGALLYKAINTMDSMIGYKNDTYRRFGTFAARLDDVVNWIPARLAALGIVGAALLNDRESCAWEIFRRDRREHVSPNAGNPEAAMAGALGIQLGGEASYFGQIVEKPTLGDPQREIVAADIQHSCRLMLQGSGLVVAALAVCGVLASPFLYN